MGYIDVDHSKFETAAKAIETYVEKHKSNMNLANQQVGILSAMWQGKDFTEFKHKWNQVTEGSSTSHKMTKALENYADFLRYAGNQYKEAQSKAVNRANNL